MNADRFNLVMEWLAPFPGMFAFDYGRYLIAALLLSGVLALLGTRFRQRRLLRTRLPEPGQRRRELIQSTLAASVFGLVGVAIHQGAHAGVFRVYGDVREFGWPYWFASLALLILAHDAYFYWTHRLLHRPSLFAWTHRTHHRSVAPTQWAAYSFAIPEALVQAAFVPLFLWFVPVHPLALFVWAAHQIVRNVLGHCGVELLPRSWLAGAWGRWVTTTLHHDLHHAHGRSNYGLYFTWWDRWCGTEHRQYRTRLQALIETTPSDSRLAEGTK